jgi:hypothetical protein
MCPAFYNPASSKIHVIQFPHAKSTSAGKICQELWVAVYGQNAMSEGTVTQWY